MERGGMNDDGHDDDVPEPHPKDGKIVDDLPNVVVDEEGFKAAAFRYYRDAQAYVESVNSRFPCACYCIEGEE